MRDVDIDPLALEVHDPVVRRDVDVDLGMALAESGQTRDEPQRGERLIGRYGQRLCGLIAADGSDRLGELVEHRLRRRVQHLPRLGEQKLAMPPFE